MNISKLNAMGGGLVNAFKILFARAAETVGTRLMATQSTARRGILIMLLRYCAALQTAWSRRF
jgi:hypothetical protein